MLKIKELYQSAGVAAGEFSIEGHVNAAAVTPAIRAALLPLDRASKIEEIIFVP